MLVPPGQSCATKPVVVLVPHLFAKTVKRYWGAFTVNDHWDVFKALSLGAHFPSDDREDIVSGTLIRRPVDFDEPSVGGQYRDRVGLRFQS